MYLKLYLIQVPFHFVIMGAKEEEEKEEEEMKPRQLLPKLDIERLMLFFCSPFVHVSS